MGKLLLIGSDDVEVWPSHCQDSHRCIQCFFNGKYPCAPRWRQQNLIAPFYVEYPPSPKCCDVLAQKGQWVSIETFQASDHNWNPFDIAQPLMPIPDGGCLEEMTKRLMVESEHIHRCLHRAKAFTRYTDKLCPRCGYQYSIIKRSGRKHPGWLYFCPQCKRQWTDNPNMSYLPNGETSKYPIYIKDFAVKLKGDRMRIEDIQLKIDEVYHRKVCIGTIKLWTVGICRAKREKGVLV